MWRSTRAALPPVETTHRDPTVTIVGARRGRPTRRSFYLHEALVSVTLPYILGIAGQAESGDGTAGIALGAQHGAGAVCHPGVAKARRSAAHPMAAAR